MATTQHASARSYFDSFKRAARRRSDPAKVVPSDGRTLILELDDGSWAETYAGVHRIQRIPKGAAARHTSTATVAVVEAHRRSDMSLDWSEVEETFDRGSGKGGQHQNTTDSAVTLVHTATGTRVHIEGRSPWQNRQTAFRELERRVGSARDRAKRESRNANRVSQIAGGERPAKGFTHNHQRGIVVDHERGRSWRVQEWAKGKF